MKIGLSIEKWLLVLCFLLLMYVDVASAVDPASMTVCSLLKNGRYEQLDKMLDKLHKQYIADYTKEEENVRAYDCFSRSNPSFEAHLNKWIAARRGSAYAYLARAKYFSDMGWDARGTNWASETKKAQFDRMENYFTKAVADIKHTISIDPNIIDAYTEMIKISKTMSSIDDKEYLDKALLIDPYAFWPRWFHMFNLLPRWGGSLSEMSRYLEATRPYFGKNPKLRVLEGLVSIEFGDSALWNKDYEKALRYYTDALKYGEVNFYYKKRGSVLKELNRFEDAKKDFDRILSTNPYHVDALADRAGCNYDLRRYVEAIKDAKTAIDLKPNSAYEHWIYGMAHYGLCDYKAAIQSLEKAKELYPSNPVYEQYANVSRGRMRTMDSCVNHGNFFNCQTMQCETK